MEPLIVVLVLAFSAGVLVDRLTYRVAERHASRGRR